MDNLRQLITESGPWYLVMSAIGGVVRIIVGADPHESFLRSAGYIFVAMVVGTLVGLTLQEMQLPQMQAMGSSVLAGIVAQNLVKGLAEIGLKEFILLITGRK